MSAVDKILLEVLKDPKAAKAVEGLELSKEQLIDALPILLEIIDEDTSNIEFVAQVGIDENGNVFRTSKRSSLGEKNKYKENIISDHLEKIDFDSLGKFEKDENRRLLISKFAKILNNQSNKGLYIYGDLGVGKTFILKKLAKKVAEAGKIVSYINLPNLVMKIKSTFGAIGISQEEIYNTLFKADVLFLDDIGAERIAHWFRDDFLFVLLNARMESNKLTFFSSNYSMNELTKKEAKITGGRDAQYDNAKRLVSRIAAISEEVLLKGANRR